MDIPGEGGTDGGTERAREGERGWREGGRGREREREHVRDIYIYIERERNTVYRERDCRRCGSRRS